MAEYEDFFNEIKAEEDCAIIHFNISNSMSVTHNNARLAGMELEDVFVIDSANLSTGQGLLVLKACELAESGEVIIIEGYRPKLSNNKLGGKVKGYRLADE
jgi:fatty acid-binding protein DegV